MDLLKYINLAEIAAFIPILAGFFVWVRRLLKSELKDIRKQVNKIIVLDKDAPLCDRVQAGETYISLGGNGRVRAMLPVLRHKAEGEYSEYYDHVHNKSVGKKAKGGDND